MRAAVIFAAALISSAAQAQNLQPYVKACDEWGEANICSMQADCPSWQWLAECAIEQASGGRMAPDVRARFDWCVIRIEKMRLRARMAAAAGNPVTDVIACLTGQ